MECIIASTPDYVNELYYNKPLAIEGSFLVYGNMLTEKKIIDDYSGIPIAPTGESGKEENKQGTTGSPTGNPQRKKGESEPPTREITECIPIETVFISRALGLFTFISFFTKDGKTHCYISLVDLHSLIDMFKLAFDYKNLGIPLTSILEKLQLNIKF